jgi:hypothetical protein
MPAMAPSKKSKTDKQKQAGRLIRVREAFLPVIDDRAEAEVTTPTELVNTLVREALEKRGLWPPRRDDD